jgi:glycosyltransferase involved in cell wall biosynthesis
VQTPPERPPPPAPLRVAFWGTYDLSKPRNRILLAGLRANGVQVDECHASVWEHVRDKGTLAPASIARQLLRTAFAYPRLIARFCRAPAPDVVLVGYLGQLDVLLLRPFARLRGIPVVWDQFISLYDTVVDDRRQLSARHPLARLLYAWEWAACRAADCVLMDTRAHAAYVAGTFGLPPERVDSVWVGAETAIFRPARARAEHDGPMTVLFYGQLIPLHGVDTIIRAARLLRDRPIRFVLVGSGQEEGRVRELLTEQPLDRLEWLPWVDYEQLIEHIEAADVCLGIFGSSAKAARVIPNKVFQIVAARRPLVTRDSPAIRELFGAGDDSVCLVPPADPRALASTLEALLERRHALADMCGRDRRDQISPEAVGRQLLEVLRRVTRGAARRGAAPPPRAEAAALPALRSSRR